MSFNGDLNSLMRLIFLEKNDVTFGVLIGLTLLVVVLMLIRSVMEEKEGAAAGTGAAIDPKSLGLAVEGAVKKALADKTVAGEKTDAPSASSGGGEASSDLKRVLDEREAKIAALMSDLDLMKNQLDAKPAEPVAGAGNADSVALHAKLAELQAKLSEYEIIEDDIADLSSFKDENKRLKEELERLRAAAQTAQSQVQAAQVTPAEPPAIDPIAAAQAAVVQSAQPVSPVDEFAETLANGTPEVKSETPSSSEPFKLDTADDVMGEFAQAISAGTSESVVDGPAAPVVSAAPAAADAIESLVVSGASGAVVDPQAAIDALMAGMSSPAAKKVDAPSEVEAAAPAENADAFGPLDTEKMLAEVASMKEETGDTASVLDEPLDTDRLMAEMGITEPAPVGEGAGSTLPEDDPAAEFAAAVAGISSGEKNVAKPAPVTTMTPPTPVAPVVPPPSETPVDDLLAEFKDTDFQSKGTKG